MADGSAAPLFERGTCARCGGAAERGVKSGAWWHLGDSCWQQVLRMPPPSSATFVPKEAVGEDAINQARRVLNERRPDY